MENISEEQYWTDRYTLRNTGWDIGYASPPLTEYIDQLEDKNIKILIPGAGNGYEAEYLISKGFTSVYVLDISILPLQNIESRMEHSPYLHLIHGDFFTHEDKYDLILEQTFFCSFYPTDKLRKAYAKKMKNLLSAEGKLVGVWFKLPLEKSGKRPFGGDKNIYLSYLDPYFDMISFETAYNSIKPRKDNELFGIFKKKHL